MIKFTKLYLEYKTYIESNSKYNPKVVKDFNYDNSYFPIIDFSYNDTVESTDSTLDRIEYYDNEYFIVTLYVKDDGEISRNIITEELIELTQKFLGRYKGMKRTTCKPIPNLDTSVLRTLMKYQCQVGNVYGNIIRR
jgi:hypothetical protein